MPFLRQGLFGNAAAWRQQYEHLVPYWGRFAELLLLEFDSDSSRVKLLAQLYGERQREDERAPAFLIRKQQLFQRLRPNEPDNERATVILELLRPSLRQIIRPTEPTTYEDLFASCLELDIPEDDHNTEEQPKLQLYQHQGRPKGSDDDSAKPLAANLLRPSHHIRDYYKISTMTRSTGITSLSGIPYSSLKLLDGRFRIPTTLYITVFRIG